MNAFLKTWVLSIVNLLGGGNRRTRGEPPTRHMLIPRFETVQQQWQASVLPVRCPICYVTLFTRHYLLNNSSVLIRQHTTSNSLFKLIQTKEHVTKEQKKTEGIADSRNCYPYHQQHTPSSQSPSHKTDDDDDHCLPLSDFKLFSQTIQRKHLVNEMSSSFPKGSHAAIFSKHIEGGNNTETDTKSTTKSKEICNNNKKKHLVL